MPERIIFAADDSHERDGLWETDGTAAGTKEIGVVTPTGGTFQSYSNFSQVAGDLVMFAFEDQSTLELLVTDGTHLNKISAPSLQALGTDIVNVGKEAYFGGEEAIDGHLYYNLWESNGTSSGTKIDNVAGSGSNFDPQFLTGYGRGALFSGEGTDNKTGLWSITASGVHEIDGIKGASATAFDPSNFMSAGNDMFFVAADGAGHRGLWITNGTASGTKEVKASGIDLPNEADGSTYVGHQLFFDNVYQNQRDLWVSNGTAAGTHRVVVDGAYGPGLHPEDFAALNGKAIFVGIAANGEEELFVSNGTTAGTKELTAPGLISVEESSIAVLGGKAYFCGADVHDRGGAEDLWVTDGTVAGTHRVGTIRGSAQAVNDFGVHGLTTLDLGDPKDQSADVAAAAAPTRAAPHEDLAQVIGRTVTPAPAPGDGQVAGGAGAGLAPESIGWVMHECSGLSSGAAVAPVETPSVPMLGAASFAGAANGHPAAVHAG